MLQKQFTQEQEAVIADWVKLYSKGKSIDFRRVQTDDAERWRTMSLAHGQGSIRAKVYYHRMTVTKDIVPKPSLNKKYVRRGPKTYQCRKCDFTTDTKQSLGVHYRYKHPVPKQLPSKINGLMDLTTGQKVITATVPESLVNQFVIVSPNGEVRPVKILNFCPECGSGAIKTHLVAHNI